MAGGRVSRLSPQSADSVGGTSTRLLSSDEYNAMVEMGPAALCFYPGYELLYHTCYRSSQGTNEFGKDITAGRLVERPFNTQLEWYQSVVQHATNRKKPSPFLSVTPDLVQAIVQACQNEHKRGVGIFIIDPRKLKPGSMIEMNSALKALEGPPGEEYNTEVLVWQNIPAEAVLCYWSWEDLKRSALFDLFPSLKSVGFSKTGKIRASRKDKSVPLIPSVSDIVNLVTGRLHMDADIFATKQVVMTMFAWSRRLRTMEEIRHFENNDFTKRDEHEIDNALYASKRRDPPLSFEDWWMRREPQAPASSLGEPDVNRIIEGFSMQKDS
jgi:hypothetical protein